MLRRRRGRGGCSFIGFELYWGVEITNDAWIFLVSSFIFIYFGRTLCWFPTLCQLCYHYHTGPTKDRYGVVPLVQALYTSWAYQTRDCLISGGVHAVQGLLSGKYLDWAYYLALFSKIWTPIKNTSIFCLSGNSPCTVCCCSPVHTSLLLPLLPPPRAATPCLPFLYFASPHMLFFCIFLLLLILLSPLFLVS